MEMLTYEGGIEAVRQVIGYFRYQALDPLYYSCEM
jgi:hypothetical protein